MPEEKFKRNIAYKLRIGNILSGKPVINEERFTFLDLNNKKVIRVNLVGSVVDKFENGGEKKYIFLTLDDGSGQIKLKSFGDDIERLKDVSHGQTVIVIGSLRYFNNELYISPEIVKEQTPKYLIVRKIETEKFKVETPQPNNEGSGREIKEKVLEMIKSSEAEGGIETEQLIAKLNESPEIVKQETQKLLEEGTIFEPRPGKLRWLG
tara:strand:- start:85 stop:708 length:624 start_codon:yes stop_codon:yes gene_type:complete